MVKERPLSLHTVLTLPRITGLRSLSFVVCACVEDTTANLVLCDSFLQVSTLTIQFSLLPGQKKHCLLVGCLTSQQHASVSLGWICTDKFTCYHTEIEVPDQTSYLTQSQYTDTGPTSPSVDPITSGAWQGSHWSANFQVTGMT